MNPLSISSKLGQARRGKGLTQGELAARCRIDIRTIQRIEAGEVNPRVYTIRLLEEALNLELISSDLHKKEDIERYRKSFQRRKKIRIAISITIISLLLLITALAFPKWELFGMPKLMWAPFFYAIMFGLIIAIGVFWRCPGCNGLLGDVLNSRYCPKCGLQFYDE